MTVYENIILYNFDEDEYTQYLYDLYAAKYNMLGLSQTNKFFIRNIENYKNLHLLIPNINDQFCTILFALAINRTLIFQILNSMFKNIPNFKEYIIQRYNLPDMNIGDLKTIYRKS